MAQQNMERHADPQAQSLAHSPGQPIVHTSYGVVCGRVRDGCVEFRGVPYADKPRRFHRPSPPTPWEGIRDCQRFGNTAVQLSVSPKLALTAMNVALRTAGLTKRSTLPEHAGSEDCLYLNITSPSLHGCVPVLCFIHGGAFLLGSGSHLPYKGAMLAQSEGVVVVSINYRLGCFGFLNIPGGDPNCGIWDQVEALRWIQSEIHRFGGDSSQVTIFGESAGGMSCGVLLSCPLAQPLFHRAILMSGALSNVMSATDAQTVAQQFSKRAGVEPHEQSLSSLSVEDLFRAQIKTKGLMPFQPCVDGELLVDFPTQALQQCASSLQRKQVILGTNMQEFNLFKMFMSRGGKTLSSTVKKLAVLLGPSRMGSLANSLEHEATEQELRDLAKQVRQEQDLLNWKEAFAHLLTMLVFEAPAYLAAEALGDVADQVYVYRFDFNAGFLGASHGAELPLLFGTYNNHWALGAYSGSRRDAASAHAVSRALMARFGAFARTGTPNGDHASATDANEEMHWPRCVDGMLSSVFVFDKECKVMMNPHSDTMRQVMDFIRRARRPLGVQVGSKSVALPMARL